MTKPQVTFFVELDTPALEELFRTPGVMDFLAGQGFGISMGLRDLSQGRAQVVRQLNARQIPVHAWLLLPEEEGYWFNAGNYRQARARYRAFRVWAEQENLRFERVGLDIEPPLNEMRALAAGPARNWLRYLWRKWHNQDWANALSAYRVLVEEIRFDGYPVDAYHIPLIADERQVKSTILARLMGLIDVPVDREVMMLYSSFFRFPGDPYGGPAFIMAYSPDTDAIGLGSTGGGVELEGQTLPSLTWEQLRLDLLTAARLADSIFVFSLEGCVRQGYLDRLAALDWSQPVSIPPGSLERMRLFRRAVQGALCGLQHIRWVVAGALAMGAVWLLWKRYRRS